MTRYNYIPGHHQKIEYKTRAQLETLRNADISFDGPRALRSRQKSKISKKPKKGRGRPRILTENQRHSLQSRVRGKAVKSARAVKESLHLSCGMKTVQRELKKVKTNYCVPKRRIRLTPVHVQQRIEFVTSSFQLAHEIEYGIYDDEKRWGMDGPAELKKCWWKDGDDGSEIDRKSSQTILNTWGFIGHNLKGTLVFLTQPLNSKRYVTLLQLHLLGLCTRTYRILLSDNCTCHCSAETEKWCKKKGLIHKFLPARSPDTNPNETIWAMMTALIYKDGKTYKTKSSLREAVRNAWNEISLDQINKVMGERKQKMLQILRDPSTIVR